MLARTSLSLIVVTAVLLSVPAFAQSHLNGRWRGYWGTSDCREDGPPVLETLILRVTGLSWYAVKTVGTPCVPRGQIAAWGELVLPVNPRGLCRMLYSTTPDVPSNNSTICSPLTVVDDHHITIGGIPFTKVKRGD